MNKSYVIAGLPRSGSTLLYNLIRLILASKFDDLNAGWMSKWKKDIKINVLKTHYYDKLLQEESYMIFTTKRDFRDVLASFKRYKGQKMELKYWCNEFYKNYKSWEEYSDYEFIYEDYLKDKNKIINELFNKLGVIMDIDKLLKQVDNVESSINNMETETLLSENHITHGGKMLIEDIYRKMKFFILKKIIVIYVTFKRFN